MTIWMSVANLKTLYISILFVSKKVPIMWETWRKEILAVFLKRFSTFFQVIQKLSELPNSLERGAIRGTKRVYLSHAALMLTLKLCLYFKTTAWFNEEFVIKISFLMLLLVLWHKNFEWLREKNRSGYKKLFELANVRVRILNGIYIAMWCCCQNPLAGNRINIYRHVMFLSPLFFWDSGKILSIIH